MTTESNEQRVALVAGAAGPIGRECLRLLAGDATVAEVRALVCDPLPAESKGPRIIECRSDIDRLTEHPDWFHVDWVFCLPAALPAAASCAAFRRADYDYPLAIARLALEQGASHFLLASAMDADPRSSRLRRRIKGELEEAVRSLGYASLTIALPASLLSDFNRSRVVEALARRIAAMLPERRRPVHPAQVAAALVRAAHAPVFGTLILENAVLCSYDMSDVVRHSTY